MRPFPHRVWFRELVASRGGRGLGVDVWTCIALAVLLATPAVAAVHPVPLDKNTDALPNALSATRIRPKVSLYIPPWPRAV